MPTQRSSRHAGVLLVWGSLVHALLSLRGATAFLTPSCISPPAPSLENGVFSASFPSLYTRSISMSATLKGIFGRTVGAIPSLVTQKAFDRMVSQIAVQGQMTPWMLQSLRSHGCCLYDHRMMFTSSGASIFLPPMTRTHRKRTP